MAGAAVRRDGARADVVVVECGGFNEWVPAVGASDRERRSSWTSLRVVEGLRRLFAKRAPSMSAAEAKERMGDLRSRDPSAPPRVPLADFEDDLRAVADWCAAHGARPVFIAHPLPESTVRDAPVCVRYADAVRRAAERAGATLVDGWAAFRAMGRPDEELFVDFCHPSPLGNEVTANAVLEALSRPPSQAR